MLVHGLLSWCCVPGHLLLLDSVEIRGPRFVYIHGFRGFSSRGPLCAIHHNFVAHNMDARERQKYRRYNIYIYMYIYVCEVLYHLLSGLW